MKKLAITLGLLLSLMTTNANAMVILISNGSTFWAGGSSYQSGYDSYGNYYSYYSYTPPHIMTVGEAAVGGAIITGALAAFAAVDGDPFAQNAFAWLAVASGVITILDVNANVPSATMVQGLSKLLPYVNNPETIREIASVAKDKFAEKVKTGKSTDQLAVSFTENEVRDLLVADGLAEAKIQDAIKKLR